METPEPRLQPWERCAAVSAASLGPAMVLGATGSFGGGVALELIARGESVRLLVRDPDKARRRFGAAAGAVEIVRGDAQNPAQLASAAEGCGVIVHAVNYPYHQWKPNMVRATEHVIAAARREADRSGQSVTILFPGNVYGLGRQIGRPLGEDAANLAETAKGSLRVQIEELLRDAAAGSQGALKVLVVRAGDYFGPTVRNGAVDPIFANAAAGKAMRYLGRAEVDHQWAYIPDLARASVDLLGLRNRFGPFEVVNFEGHIARPQREFLRLVAEAAGKPDLPVKPMFPWALAPLVGVLMPVVREMIELRYLWDEPLILDGSKLRRLLPEFRETPIGDAVRTTVDSYQRSQA